MKGFMDFIREQGVVGLAVAFILGASVTKVVNSLVEDVVSPLLGLLLGKVEGLTSFTVSVGDAQLMLGSFIAVLIDFIVVAAVVYVLVKSLKVEKLDKKK